MEIKELRQNSSAVKSKFLNVYWHKCSGKWMAKVNFNRAQHHLGIFSSEHDASDAVTEFKVANAIELDPGADILTRVEYICGHLVWRENGAQHWKGNVVGSSVGSSGYMTFRQGSKKLYLHRLVWQLFNGEIPADREIDHINGNRSDNTIENLRLVTRLENNKNVKLRGANKTGVTGVSKNNIGRYVARIREGGKTIELGHFHSLEAATAARTEAAKTFGYHANHGRRAA
jgi:HNH endonuclease